MKKFLTKFLAISGVALLLFPSCKKDGTLVTSNGGKAGTLTASVATLPLDKTKVNDTSKVIHFTFSAANYGFSAAVTNTLQIDAAGDNWAHPTSVTLPTKVLSMGYSTFDFNNIVLKLNLAAGVASQVMVRVSHSISTNVAPVYSNVLSLTVTPFNLTSWVYVPGAYEGWSFPGTNADSLVSVTGNGIYTGIINFTANNNQFLIVPAQSWSNKWATTSPGVNPTTPSVTYPVTYNGPNNFYAPTTPGNYLITFDSNANTISIVPADFYSIIGSSTPGGNWSTDLFLKFINDGNNNWVGTFPMLAGEYKFRFDGQWNTSWGPGATAGTAVTSGAVGDGNIPLSTAGNYTITINQPPTAAGGPTPPLGTTTFTAVKN